MDGQIQEEGKGDRGEKGKANREWSVQNHHVPRYGFGSPKPKYSSFTIINEKETKKRNKS